MSETLVFSGEKEVNGFVMLAMASGLKLYAKTGMKPARGWSPTNMLKAASRHTGVTYKRGEYLKAAEDLRAKAGVA